MRPFFYKKQHELERNHFTIYETSESERDLTRLCTTIKAKTIKNDYDHVKSKLLASQESTCDTTVLQ